MAEVVIVENYNIDEQIALLTELVPENELLLFHVIESHYLAR